MTQHSFYLPTEQASIDAALRDLVSRFDDDYWLACDQEARFPEAYRQAIVEGGWLGITMPEDCGGSALGVTDAAVMMHALADSGGGMAAASSIHMNIFGPMPLVRHGSQAQRERWLPELINGDVMACFAVTEPDAGLDTGRIKTRAVLKGDRYVVNGRKIWTSTAQKADRILLLARTGDTHEPNNSVKDNLETDDPEKDEVSGNQSTPVSSVDGLSLFYTVLDKQQVEVREIHKMGRHSVDSNMLFFDDYEIPADHLIGTAGDGFRYLIEGLNPERILVAAEAVAIGRQAITRACNYARERVVFGRPIGKNQGIAHPLADCWMKLEAAWLMTLEAARRYDNGEPAGAQANAAKYLAADAGHDACERAVLTHGGMGYASEFHVERLLRESYIPRIAPVSGEMVLNFIAERVLHLPRSY